MNRDTAYSILYKDGSCNHDPIILDIFKEIIYKRHLGKVDINDIDRWNIYFPDNIHLVYTLNIKRNFSKIYYPETYQHVFPISEFANKWRVIQLDKLEI